MQTITLQQLRDHNACANQVELFQKYFGSEVELTPEVVQKYASEFDIYWCAQNLLTPELYERYEEAKAIALKPFEEAIAIALKHYEEAIATPWKHYEEAIATHWKQSATRLYDGAIAIAREQYDEARVILFVSLYNQKSLANHILRKSLKHLCERLVRKH